MVKVGKSLVAATAIVSGASAVTTMSVTDEKVQMIELSVYVRDIVKHMGQYLSFRSEHPDQAYPSVMNKVVLKAMFGSGDSWTSYLTGIDPSTVQMMLTGVPWYSTRILPALDAYLSSAGIVVEGINCSDCDATTSTPTTSSTSSVTPTLTTTSITTSSSSMLTSSSSSTTTTTSFSSSFSSSSSSSTTPSTSSSVSAFSSSSTSTSSSSSFTPVSRSSFSSSTSTSSSSRVSSSLQSSSAESSYSTTSTTPTTTKPSSESYVSSEATAVSTSIGTPVSLISSSSSSIAFSSSTPSSSSFSSQTSISSTDSVTSVSDVLSSSTLSFSTSTSLTGSVSSNPTISPSSSVIASVSSSDTLSLSSPSSALVTSPIVTDFSSSSSSVSSQHITTTMSVTQERVQMIELAVYVRDIVNNMNQYLDYRESHPDEPYPSQLNNVVVDAMFDDTDDNWTTELTGINPSTVQMMLTGVPWYSQRILPVLRQRLNKEGIAVKGINLAEIPNTSTSKINSTSSITPSSTMLIVSATTTDSVNTTSISPLSAVSSKVSGSMLYPVDPSMDFVPSSRNGTIAPISPVYSSSSKPIHPISSNIPNVAPGNVTTKWNTVTSHYGNTTTITSCSSESTSTVDVYQTSTSVVTKTICNTVCKSKFSEASEAEYTFVTTKVDGAVVTETVCDTVCKSKKSEASAAQVVTSFTVYDTTTVTETICDEECIRRKSENNYVTDVTRSASSHSGEVPLTSVSYPIVTGTTVTTKPTVSLYQQESNAATNNPGSTVGISQYSENKAVRDFVGMGAYLLAAGILLI